MASDPSMQPVRIDDDEKTWQPETDLPLPTERTKNTRPSSSPTHSYHEEVHSQRGGSGSEATNDPEKPLNTKNTNTNSSSSTDSEKTEPYDPDSKRELTDDECYEQLGFCFPTWRKWTILSVIFTVQMSMNFNTSVYPDVVPLLADHFGVSEQAARCGQMSFLVAYGEY